MEIIEIDSYRDGGTMSVKTEQNMTYCVDNRINSKTKGSIFLDYPKKDNSNIIEKQDEIRNEMINAIKKYTDDKVIDFDWRPRLKEVLNIL